MVNCGMEAAVNCGTTAALGEIHLSSTCTYPILLEWVTFLVSTTPHTWDLDVPGIHTMCMARRDLSCVQLQSGIISIGKSQKGNCE